MLTFIGFWLLINRCNSWNSLQFTMYVCVGSGRPFKLTREMLDAIDEAGRRDHGGDPAHENVGRMRFQDLDAHGRESQEDTRVDFDIALVPDKNLLHVPLRNCNQVQLKQQMSKLQY